MSEIFDVFLKNIGSYFRIYFFIIIPITVLSIVGYLFPDNLVVSIFVFVVSGILSFLGGIYILSFSAYIYDENRDLNTPFVSISRLLSDSKRLLLSPLIPLMVFLVSIVAGVLSGIALVLHFVPRILDVVNIAISLHIPDNKILVVIAIVCFIVTSISYHALYFSFFYSLEKVSFRYTHIIEAAKHAYKLALKNFFFLLGFFLLLFIITSIIHSSFSLLDVLLKFFQAGDNTLDSTVIMQSILAQGSLPTYMGTLTQEQILQLVKNVSMPTLSSIVIAIPRRMIDCVQISLTFLTYAHITKKYLQKLTINI